MIEDGDRIAVGVSGGKDSMTMLAGLAKLQTFFPKKFSLEAITITMGIGEFDTAPITAFCEKLGVAHTVEETFIGRIIFELRDEKNPCSMCSNLRRGALNEVALRLGCNKLALAHNQDDVVETMMMSLFYEGRIHVFSPVTHFKRKNITMIRPLIYVWEKEINGFIRSEGIKPVKNPCPANGNTARQDMKEMLLKLSLGHRDLKACIAGAIKRSGIDGWTPLGR
jgi:tRNA 2-thiocytidine biosynthesis protein TtcA